MNNLDKTRDVTQLGSRRPRLMLESLPDDILFEVVKFCQPDPARNIPLRFSVLHAVSLVNRRFRTLAVLLLHRELIFPTQGSFRRALKHYEGDGANEVQKARAVR